MKTCTKCKIAQNVDQFRKDATRKDNLYYTCKTCCSAAHKAIWIGAYRDQRNAASVDRRIEHKQRIDQYKSVRGCKVCTETDPCCLDLHHKDDTKEFTVSLRLNSSWNRILREVEKCVVLCANCHRKHHAGKLNLY